MKYHLAIPLKTNRALLFLSTFLSLLFTKSCATPNDRIVVIPVRVSIIVINIFIIIYVYLFLFIIVLT